MRGVTAGVVVFSGIATANAGNAIFNLISARWMGPTGYGDLATLLALLGLVSLPLAGVQLTLAQTVARAAALRDAAGISNLYRRCLEIGFAGSVAVAVVGLGLSGALGDLINVHSRTAVVLTVCGVVPAVLTPVTTGLAQGLERFVLYSSAQVIAPILRIALVVPFLIAGWKVAGAMGATLASTTAAAAVTAWILRPWSHRKSARPSHPARQEMRTLVVPAVVGILAFTSLTTIDIVVAKVALGGRETGLYGAASLTGRLILYLPAAIVSVLLPKVSSRVAVGRETGTLLWSSLLATSGLCSLATVVYALAPQVILESAFGADYSSAAHLLWMFGVEMTIFAVLNVLFIYDLGRRDTRTVRLLTMGAVAQLAGYAAFHETAEQLLLVNITTAMILVTVSLAHRSGFQLSAIRRGS